MVIGSTTSAEFLAKIPKKSKGDHAKECSTKLRIAILQDEIALWEKRCDTEPRSNLYYGYIRDMMTNRVKELSAEQEK